MSAFSSMKRNNMKEFKLQLIVKGSPDMDIDTIKLYLEAFMINSGTLEHLILKSAAGDKMPAMGLDIQSIELKKEKEKENVRKPKKRKPKKSVSTAV
jgi:hypothetical protein